MPNGKVKWFNPKKGFGFIERDDGVEFYVDEKSLQETNAVNLETDQRVTFMIDNQGDQPKAVDVKLVI